MNIQERMRHVLAAEAAAISAVEVDESFERAVEMINYLIFHTVVKDELAAGFKPSYQSTMTSLERLVQTADIPNAGESLSGFALATIFQHMAATNLQIRKEGFEGKEVTMAVVTMIGVAFRTVGQWPVTREARP